MLRLLLFVSFIGFFSVQADAQRINKHLSGHWKGYITQGSLDAKTGPPFEMYLKVRGSKITGRTYIYLKDGEILEMDVRGTLYSDNSFSLEEGKFIETEGFDATPTHYKKYQFVHNRSVFESENTLDGYWQEIIETPLALKRRRGKVFLRKVTQKKA